jgi:PKD repeat protein
MGSKFILFVVAFAMSLHAYADHNNVNNILDKSSVRYNEVITYGSSQISVNTDMQGARVALFQNDAPIGKAITDEYGNATVKTFEPIVDPNPITILVTKDDESYKGIISVLVDAPHIILNNYTLTNSPDYGATVGMNAEFKNLADIGSGYDAQNVVANLSTADEYITINDGVENLGSIIAGDSILLSDAFSFTIADSIPDQHVVNFQIEITGNDKENYTWMSVAYVVLNAPELIIGDLSVDDVEFGNGDGTFDPGETVKIQFLVENVGHASISNVLSTLSITDGQEYMTLTNTEFIVGDLNVGESLEIEYEATSGSSVLLGTPVYIEVAANGVDYSQYGVVKNDMLIIGFVPNYCQSGAYFDSGSDLTEFSFGPLYNNSEGDNGTYDDYTLNEELVFEFMQGATYDISITLSSLIQNNYKGAKVFADWNHDGDFADEGEEVFTVSPQSYSFTQTGSVTIPSDVELGPTYLRVVLKETEYVSEISPCGSYFLGGTEDYKIIIVPLEIPIADFEASATETTQDDVIAFIDKSVNQPSSWQWTITPGVEIEDFMYVNGTTSTNQNPQVMFRSQGQYSIELAATNAEGSDTVTKTNYIIINEITDVPTALFTIDDSVIIPGDELHLTDLSTNTPTAWEWTITPGSEGTEFEFADGTDMFSENPIVVFNSPGNYTIQLVASNFIGNSEPLIESDIVEVLPMFLMQSGDVYACGGTFYDEGGPLGNYFNSSNMTMTFFPTVEGKMLKFNFIYFEVGDSEDSRTNDRLLIFDGPQANLDLIGSYDNSNIPDSIIASNYSGALTFVFQSDSYVNHSGWSANISCVDGLPIYEVKLIVTLDGQPVGGVLIMCDGGYRVTNSNGEAVLYLTAGVYEYTLSVSASGPETGSFEVVDEDLIVNLAYTDINSLPETVLYIYPNPVIGILNVELDKEIGKYQIEIIDLHGKTVIYQSNDHSKSTIDISSLSEGVYQLVIQNDLHRYVQRIIKQ